MSENKKYTAEGQPDHEYADLVEELGPIYACDLSTRCTDFEWYGVASACEVDSEAEITSEQELRTALAHAATHTRMFVACRAADYFWEVWAVD